MRRPTGFDLGCARAKARARELLAYYSLERGGEADLRDLACDRGLLILDKQIRGSEGRLVRRGKRAIATISTSIEHAGKRTFVTAHELGHFELHRESLFICDAAAFVDWHRRRPEETEANQFAAELLMPTRWFLHEARRLPLSFDLIAALAEGSGVSLTAAAFRYVELDATPSALVFCRHGKIEWYLVSTSFPYGYIQRGQPPHPYSGAGEYLTSGKTSPYPEPTPSTAWFLDENVSSNHRVCEQCLPMPNLNATLSLIWEE